MTVSVARTHAILQALFVTFLWSTSWVLIKVGLQTNLPPLTFAGLRYSLAFLCLIPFVLSNAAHRRSLRALTPAGWAQLALLGVLFYALTQGAQFVGLAFLPAATLTLLLNFSPVVVALAGGLLNQEPSTPGQWGGLLLSVAGAIVYFLPLDIPAGQRVGLAVAFVGVLANAASSLLGRRVNRGSGLSPLAVTSVSMGVGGALLLAVGAATGGFGRLGAAQWLIIIWLAVVNTAVAFTLWNHTLRALTAVESSVINNTMLPQIAILAWLFLDEPLSARQIVGITLVGVGTLVVQVWGQKKGVQRATGMEVERE